MPEEKKTDTTEVKKEVDEKDTEETKESKETKEESDESESSDTDSTDYDAEIEAEKKRGKPDLLKAKKAFDDREAKRKAEEESSQEEADEEERPLTQKDLVAVEARVRQEMQEGQALDHAKALSGNPKQAELVVARWKNRGFPKDMPLSEQIEEVFAGLHRKKLIGERDEALRGLKNKDGRQSDTSNAERQGLTKGEPKIPAAEAVAYKAAGFVWNSTSRLFEKKLPNGQILIKDLKTKRTSLQQK